MVASGAEIQPDKNWTKIHNSILELLATSSFTAREFRCLMFLLRMTYGYQCKEAAISLTEWENGTDLRRGHVNTTLKGLVARHVITKTETGTRSKPVWSFNKYFEQWQSSTPVGTGFNSTPLGTTNSTDMGTTNGTPLGTKGSTPVQCATTPYKERKENGKESEPVSLPPVEQPEKVQSAAPIPKGDYFGMRRPIRKEKITVDGYTQEAAKLGLPAASYVALVDTLVKIAGWGALIDTGEESKLNYAKQDALKLAILGYAEPDQLKDLAAAYRKTYHWRNTPPQPKDLAEYASQVQAGVIQEGQESRPTSGREIVTVKFAKPGDDIYA